MPPKRKSLAAEDSDSGDDFGGEDGEFRITNALKPSRATTYTAQALYDQIHTGDIILDPEYQRDVVWSKDKQTRLIDSILRNFYVPPVIFASNVKEDGAETKTCIDGKQRLTSILLFMDGQIPLIDPDTNQRLYYKTPPGDTKKKLLPEQYRRLFAYKQIVCVEYSDLSGQNERDIFQRVQLGVALTPSEKLQALDSPRCRFVRDLAGDDAVQNLPFEKKRAADFRVIAHVVHAIDRMDWLSNVTDSHQLERWLQVDDEISSDLQQKIRKSVGAVAEMGLKPNGKAKRISPMELLAVLTFAHFRRLDGLDHTQLHSEVKALRTAFKAAFPELKLNGFCGRWAVEYINEMRGSSPTGKGSAKRTKRRRTADDEDGDFNPQMLPSPS